MPNLVAAVLAALQAEVSEQQLAAEKKNESSKSQAGFNKVEPVLGPLDKLHWPERTRARADDLLELWSDGTGELSCEALIAGKPRVWRGCILIVLVLPALKASVTDMTQ